MKPIVKIKNPVMRFLMGSVILAALIAAVAEIFYLIGYLAKALLVWIGVHVVEGSVPQVMHGAFLVCVLLALVLVLWGIVVAAMALGEEFFDP